MNIQHVEQNNKTLLLALFAAMAGVLMGFAIGVVWGAEIPESYNETMDATVNATNQTEGFAVDNYIETVKKDICKTLTNATEYEGCMKL